MNFYVRVYELVLRIPAGKCASYGQLALMLGNPRASRAVGHAMRACRTPGVPCHRVVREDGALSGYRWGTARKAQLLAREAQHEEE